MAKAAKARPDRDEFQLAREIEAAKILRAQIAELTAGEDADKDLIRDMVEGELAFGPLLDAMIANEARDKELLVGIKTHADDLARRKARIENRVEKRRALMMTALQLAELDKHESPEGTLSLRATPVACDVVEEADIPAEFFRDPAPVLDKRALLDKLKEVEADNAKIMEEWEASGSNEPPVLKSIPGAALRPAGQTVAIR